MSLSSRIFSLTFDLQLVPFNVFLISEAVVFISKSLFYIFHMSNFGNIGNKIMKPAFMSSLFSYSNASVTCRLAQVLFSCPRFPDCFYAW